MISLQPTSVLKREFQALFKHPNKNLFSIELWKEFIKESDHFSAQEFTKSNFFYLTNSSFV
jgi:hypothetical protein